MYNEFASIDDGQRRKYAALTSYLDHLVGQLVAELRAHAMYDKTLIVFSSGTVHLPTLASFVRTA